MKGNKKIKSNNGKKSFSLKQGVSSLKNVLRIFKYDYSKILTSWVTVVILIGLTVLPPIYAWLNIYASWDPYGNTKGLKVAVINEDAGGTLLNVDFNIGAEIVSTLKTNDKLGWIFCDSEDEGLKMVQDGDVYAAIIIPEDFSLSLTTILDDNPKKLSIDYYKNQKLNAIAPKIIDSATNTLKTEISTSIIETAVSKVLENINTISADLKEDYPNLQNSINLLDKIRDNVDDLPTKLNNLTANVQDGVVTVDTASDDFADVQDTIDDLVAFNASMSDVVTEAGNDIEEYTPEVRSDLASAQTLFNDVSEDAKYLSNEIATKKPELISDIGDLRSNLKSLKSDVNDVNAVLTKLNGDGITDTMELNKDIISDIDNMLTVLTEIQNNTDDLSDMKSLLNKLGNLSDDLGDNLDDLEDQTDDIFTTSDTILASLEDTSKELADLVSDLNNKDTKASLTATMNTIVNNLTSINKTLEKNKETFSDIIDANNKIIASLKAMSNNLVSEDDISDLNSSVNALSSSLDSVSQSSGSYGTQTANALTDLEDVLGQLNSLLTQLQNSNTSGNTATVISSLISTLTSINSMLQNLTDISSALITTNTAIINSLTAISQDLNGDGLTNLEKNLKDLNSEISTFRKEMTDNKDDVSEELDDAADVFHQVDKVCDNLSGTITDLSSDITTYSGSLSTTLGELKEILGKTNAELTVIQEDGSTDIKEGTENINDMINTLSTRLKEVSDSLGNSDRLVTTLDDMGTVAFNAGSAVGTVLNSMDDEALDNLENNLASGSGLFQDINEVLVNSKDALDDLSTFSDDVAADGQTTVDRLEAVKEDVPTIQTAVTKITDKIDKLNGDVTYDDLINLVHRDVEEDSEYFSSPVELSSHDVYVSENYGKGLAPFYSVLALWVGGMFLGALLKTKVEHPNMAFTPKEEYFGRYLLFGLVAFAQGLVTALGDLFILRIPVHNPVVFIMLCSFFSLIFSMMMYALVSTLDNVGKALGIILLLLQVTASGGTFPIQVTPVFFRTINKFMPFTYAISGLREAIYGVVFDNLAKDLVTLLLFGIIFTLYGCIFKERLNNLFKSFTLNMKKSGIIH